MAAPSTLFRFRITADSSPSVIDLRVALHPSETRIFMVTRLIAYVLNFQDGIEFGPGLSDPDAPAIRVTGIRGETSLWIDIGNPSAKRLHKASKAATSVKIYTHKNVTLLKEEVAGEKIYNFQKIEIYAIDDSFLEELAELLERDNHWQISVVEDELQVTVDDEMYSTSFELHRLDQPR
jgi:uncharacterized protein YaeQ